MHGPSRSWLWVSSSLPIASLVGWRVSIRPCSVIEMLPASTLGMVSTAETTIWRSVSSRSRMLRRWASPWAALRRATRSSSFWWGCTVGPTSWGLVWRRVAHLDRYAHEAAPQGHALRSTVHRSSRAGTHMATGPPAAHAQERARRVRSQPGWSTADVEPTPPADVHAGEDTT